MGRSHGQVAILTIILMAILLIHRGVNGQSEEENAAGTQSEDGEAADGGGNGTGAGGGEKAPGGGGQQQEGDEGDGEDQSEAGDGKQEEGGEGGSEKGENERSGEDQGQNVKGNQDEEEAGDGGSETAEQNPEGAGGKGPPAGEDSKNSQESEDTNTGGGQNSGEAGGGPEAGGGGGEEEEGNPPVDGQEENTNKNPADDESAETDNGEENEGQLPENQEGNSPGDNGGGTGSGAGPASGSGPGTGEGEGTGPPTTRPSVNPPVQPPPVYPPVNPPFNPLPINPPNLQPQWPDEDNNNNIDEDPFGFGQSRSGQWPTQSAPIPVNNFDQNGQFPMSGRRVPGMTWVPTEERSQLPMVVSGNGQRGNWRGRNMPARNGYGGGWDSFGGPNAGNAGNWRFNAVPAFGYQQGNGAVLRQDVQRFPQLQAGQLTHLCIRPSPNTKNLDLWRHNNVSSGSPLHFYNLGVPPSQWQDGYGRNQYYAPYSGAAGPMRSKRQTNNWQGQGGQVPQICTTLQNNIDSNGFGQAREKRRRRKRSARIGG